MQSNLCELKETKIRFNYKNLRECYFFGRLLYKVEYLGEKDKPDVIYFVDVFIS